MANEKNLKPQNTRTKKEQREIAQKGGKASGVARRRKKSMKELAKMMLSFPAKQPSARKLKAAGFDPADANNGASLVQSMVSKAISGDVQAAKFVVELIGEGMTFERKLKQDASKATAQQGAQTSSAMQQLVETLRASE